MLLHALNKINGKWKATIIGDGSKRKVLESAAEILRINENISWSGWKEDPWESVEEASICISTSNTEGFALQQVCISSVEKFSDDIVISNIESAIIKELE